MNFLKIWKPETVIETMDPVLQIIRLMENGITVSRHHGITGLKVKGYQE